MSIMIYGALFLFLSCVLPITLAAPAPAATTTPTRPPKGACTISAIAVAPDVDTDGSGCQPGTVGVAISEDNSLMTFIFDNFQAAIGPKAGDAKKRALCKVNVTMSSAGWAFDVASVDFRGYVSLPQGVSASIVSRWKWVDLKGVDMKGKGNMQKKLAGPFKDDFLLHKDGEVSNDETSVCSKASAQFQITLSISLASTSSTATGVVQGGSLDNRFKQELSLGWRKC